MRALSLSNPWPWAIVHAPADLAKRIENRSWPPPYAAIGQVIALHVAKSWDDGAISFMLARGLDPPASFASYPKSAVIGVATVDRCVTEVKTLDEVQRRWFFESREDGKQNYGWVLTDVRALATPVACGGKQGLWTLPADVEAAVLDQLRGAA